MRTGIVIQCRMGSTRFPGKALAPFRDTTLLGSAMARLRRVTADAYIVATDEASFEALKPVVRDAGWTLFVGPADDVMLRVMEAAREHNVGVVVRATGDNPLVDATLTRHLLDLQVWSGADATRPFGHTPGTAVEVVTYDALCRAWPGASVWQREHVMPAIYENWGYHVNVVWCRPTYREAVTVDTPEDLTRVEALT